MIDLAFYADIVAAFAAGVLVTSLAAAIGNSLARYRVTFRTDDGDAQFNGDLP
jgi:hypothetical protein